MQATFEQYSKAYKHVKMRREDGIIELQFHSQDGPLIWGSRPHRELGYCFADVGSDPENHVVIMTGTGDVFLMDADTSWANAQTPDKWDKILNNGRRLLQNLLDIEVPVISAINGPARIHAELMVLNDICVMADDAYLSDEGHFITGVTSGDGVHVIWPALLGPNRGRHFLMTGQQIYAAEAKQLGVVAEVLPKDQVLPRAWALARQFRKLPNKTLRYTRMAVTQPMKKLLMENLNFGLALEGLAGYEYWPDLAKYEEWGTGIPPQE